MIPIRAAIWISGFLGVLYALIGLFQSLPDVGAGMTVAALSVMVWGLCDWVEQR